MRIAVTGATGNLGRLIINFLLERGVAPSDIVAIIRDEAKATALAAQGVETRVADYADAAALAESLKGVDRLMLVSGSDVGQRFAQHSNVIAAAKAQGVSFIAYTSLLHADTSELALAPEHKATEELLATTGIDHTILRNGWYWENYAAALQSGKSQGKFFSAAGEAKVSGAARKDYAEAAAVVISAEGHAGKVYELAGAPALTYQGIADEVAKVIGQEVTYVNLSVAEYQDLLTESGMPTEFAAVFAGMDPLIGQGALYSDSTDLQDLIGHQTTTLAEALSA